MRLEHATLSDYAQTSQLITGASVRSAVAISRLLRRRYRRPWADAATWR